MSVFDSPLAVLAVIGVGVVVWWRLTGKAPWDGPGSLRNLREQTRRYLEARDAVDKDAGTTPPRRVPPSEAG